MAGSALVYKDGLTGGLVKISCKGVAPAKSADAVSLAKGASANVAAQNQMSGSLETAFGCQSNEGGAIQFFSNDDAGAFQLLDGAIVVLKNADGATFTEIKCN